jgi:hypothetical protein
VTCAHSRRTFRDRDFLASAIDPKPLPGEATPTRLCSECFTENRTLELTAVERMAIELFDEQHARAMLVEDPQPIGVRELAIAYLDLVTAGGLR